MWRWTLVGLVVVVLPTMGGIRGPTIRLNQLTIDGATHGGGSWTVSSPTMEAQSGYLTYDASGKSPKVSFSYRKGAGTSWSFVETTRFDEYESKGMRGGWYVSEERSGYTMKIRAAEGPFQGWYLGREDGKLVLVKDRRKAATLRMLEKVTEVKGK